MFFWIVPLNYSQMNVIRIVIIAAFAVILPGRCEETSKDDMWRALQNDSREIADEQTPTYQNESMVMPAPTVEMPIEKDGKGHEGAFRQFMRNMAIQQIKAGHEKWPEANIEFDFKEGWMRADMPVMEGSMKRYINESGFAQVFVGSNALATGDNACLDEFSSQEHFLNGAKVELVELQPTGRETELGMRVYECNDLKINDMSFSMKTGRVMKNGGLYTFTVVSEDKKLNSDVLSNLFDSLRWTKPEKDMRKPPVAMLSVKGAGFSLPCGGAMLVDCIATLPYGVAANRLNMRVEMSALEVSGCGASLEEMAEMYLGLLALSENGNFNIQRSKFGGINGLTVKPIKDTILFGKATDWRADFALRDGFLCVMLGYWSKGNDGDLKNYELLRSKVEFVKPEGEQSLLKGESAKKIASLFYNEIGLKAFEDGKYTSSTRAFKHACDAGTENYTISANLVNSLSKQGRLGNALDAVVDARKRTPDDQNLKAWHAALLVQTGAKKEGAEMYEELFKAGFRKQDEILIWINALQEIGKSRRAVEIAKIINDETRQLSAQRIYANCLWVDGDLTKANDEYKKLAHDLKEESSFVSDYASLKLDCGDYAGVLETLASWEDSNELTNPMKYAKGMAEIGLGRMKAAVVTLKSLNEEMSGNQAVKEALAHAQAMVGRGSNEGIRDDLEEVNVPDDLLERAEHELEDMVVEENYVGEGFVFLSNIKVWEWNEGDDARMSHYQSIKILDASGVHAYSTFFIPFKPNSEWLNVNCMKVIDGDQKVTSEFKREEMYVRDANSSTADGLKYLCIPVPSLKVGSVVEVVYTKQILGSQDVFPMASEWLPDFNGLVYGAVVFKGDLSKLNFSCTRTLTERNGSEYHVFEATVAKKLVGSNYLPPYDEWGKLCWAWDKRSTWETETKDYLSEIKCILDDDAFAAGVVSELGLLQKPKSEVIQSVVRWLNDKFQYQGLEFGRRARLPTRGELVLTRGFGDCKDFSVMTRAILRAAGVKANLALVSSTGVVREEVTSFDQFDHMVLVLPEFENAVLDPTIRYFNTPDALARNAIGAKAFVIEGDQPGFVPMKEKPVVQRSIVIKRDVKVDPDTGDVLVDEEVHISPAQATTMRYLLINTPQSERLKAVESLFRKVESSIELKSIDVEGAKDSFTDLSISIKYVVAGAFRLNDGVLSGSSPSVFEGWFFRMEQERDRSIDVLIKARESCSVENVIHVPSGYHWEASSPLKVNVVNPMGLNGNVEWKADENVLTLKASMELMPTRCKAEQYNDLCKAGGNLLRQLDAPIQFVRD